MQIPLGLQLGSVALVSLGQAAPAATGGKGFNRRGPRGEPKKAALCRVEFLDVSRRVQVHWGLKTISIMVSGTRIHDN